MNKKEVLQQGISVIDSTSFIKKQKNERLEQLKKLIPELVNSDGQLNTQALHDFIDISQTTSNNKGYELTFAGKGIARAMAATETTKELKVEKAQSKNFDSTENVVIRGDNLEVLKILKQNYFEKIKMIYIDPPYNTGNDGFIYNNDFKKNEEELIKNFGLGEETSNFLHNVYGTKSHSGWLSFMYPRLKLARDLLKEDGIIAIAIDHYELNNLTCIADEIFGEENRLGLISVVHKAEGRNQVKFFAPSNEFMLIYAKNINNCNFENTVIDNKIAETFNQEDEKGKYRLNNYLRTGGGAPSLRINKPEFFYPIYVSSDLKDISLENKNGYVEILPITNTGEERTWKTKKETFYKSYLEKNIITQKNENGKMQIYEKYREKQVLKTYWHQPKYHAIHHGTNRVSNLLGGSYFDFPKSVYLVQDILKIATNPNDIILDFFAGSGTTGDAVMQLNAEDGGNRKYILVQWDEAIAENTEAHKFCTENNFEPVISSICIERLNRAGEKIRQEQKAKNGLQLEAQNIDIGYKVFSLTEKQKIIETTENNQSLFQLANKRTSTENTLYNMLCATRKSLDTKIQEIIKDRLYKADGEMYLLSNVSSEDLESCKDHKINIDGYSDISLEHWLNLGIHTDTKNVSVVY